jgi:hypothetical protein
MRIALVVGVLVAAAPAARAGKPKPSAAEAKQAAQAWIDAMELGEDTDIIRNPAKLTASPFFSIARDDDSDAACPESTASDPAAIRKALDCLRQKVHKDGTLRAWTAKRAKANGLAHIYKKQLAALARTATLVVLDQDCEGTFNEVILATVKDDAAAVKVSAALSMHGACGE